eukprot:gene5844-6437_t
MLEEEYFGPKIGSLSLHEASWVEFNQNCSSSSSQQSDQTGQRMYAGAHVAIRFLVNHPELVEGQSVIELGCGTGVFGLLAYQHSVMKRLVLTDGIASTLHITQQNISHLLPSSTRQSPVTACQLAWDNQEDIQAVKKNLNEGRGYDVVLGCELMYYKTDVHTLLQAVWNLCEGDEEEEEEEESDKKKKEGLFIHCHLFRRLGQEEEVINLLAQQGWQSLEILGKDFLCEEELSQHPEWYSMRMLVSVPIERIASLQQRYPSWIPFQAVQPEDVEVNENEEDEEEVVVDDALPLSQQGEKMLATIFQQKT